VADWCIGPFEDCSFVREQLDRLEAEEVKARAVGGVLRAITRHSFSDRGVEHLVGPLRRHHEEHPEEVE
jgi:hypothetical protein